MNRTYDWNGNTNLPISGPQYSDNEIAGMVRMLSRNDMDHEAILCAARDRIMALVKEKQTLADEAKKLKKILSHVPALVAIKAREDAGFPNHVSIDGQQIHYDNSLQKPPHAT